MSEQNTSANNADEAPNAVPPTVPVVEEPCVEINVKTSTTDDIPVADADTKEEEKKVEKVVNKPQEKTAVTESPKDLKEDPIGWINSLFPEATHKVRSLPLMSFHVNYQILSWMQKLAAENDDKKQPLPGKCEAVTKNQFLGFLRDGSVLAKIAKRLQPDSVDKVHEGDEAKDKDKQLSNINAFIKFAKDLGLSDQQVFSATDLQEKGKAGYQAVFNTIVQLGLKVNERYEQKGIDVDQLAEVASQAVRSSLMQTILSFFRRAKPNTQTTKQLAKEAEEKVKAEKATEKVAEEKPAAAPVTVDDTPAAAPAVAAATVEQTAVAAN
uniref:Calponin-homology (CH) domain-containing protein n=1 Tax=Syphacia muris TaxID=451379 RepID=A0A0N5AV58_9BILA